MYELHVYILMANKQAIYAFAAACTINFIFVGGPEHTFLPFFDVLAFFVLVVGEKIPCQCMLC